MDFPVIVKPCCGGSSVGVCIAKNQEEYEAALKESFSYENEAVVEQFIEGREFSVAVVDGKAYPVIEIAPLQGFYDYKNKYEAGSTIETCPAELPETLTRRCRNTRSLDIRHWPCRHMQDWTSFWTKKEICTVWKPIRCRG